MSALRGALKNKGGQMTFVWKHPSKYKKIIEDQKDETVPVSENTEDKDELNEPQDPQSQE